MRGFARSQKVMTDKFIETNMGWGNSTFRNTNYKKYYKDFMEKLDNGFRVYSHFLLVPKSEFLIHVSQSNPYFGKYKRYISNNVAIYEFLLPLTREDKLRTALDNLFFRDTILLLSQNVNLEAIRAVLDKSALYRSHKGEDDATFRRSIADIVGDLFGGYSIHHVNGRYKTDTLIEQKDVHAWEEKNSRKYIHDETTACVRFIVPCPSSKVEIRDDKYDYQIESKGTPKASFEDYAVIRALFFEFFAETVVRTVRGEEEIWLLEYTNERRLYIWEKTS